jgi:hypothetical protein
MANIEAVNSALLPTSLTRPFYAYEANCRGFMEPNEKDVPLWRYMDFTKFVSLLASKGVFFARANRLGDSFEGSLTRAEIEERQEIEGRFRKRQRGISLHGLTSVIVREAIENTIVSCWHMNEVESMAMWKLYLSATEGIAVRSTFRRFTSCFKKCDGRDKGYNQDKTERELRTHVGLVRYVDFDAPSLLKDVPRIMLKRKSFAHEREIRAVAIDCSFQSDPGRPTRFPSGGDVVPVNLQRLIHTVFVAPKSPSWFSTLVTDVVRKYGYEFPVRQSDLSRDPVY